MREHTKNIRTGKGGNGGDEDDDGDDCSYQHLAGGSLRGQLAPQAIEQVLHLRYRVTTATTGAAKLWLG